MHLDLTRPIIGIENRTAQEVFDIMCDRIRSRLSASIPAEIEAVLKEAWALGRRSYCPAGVLADEARTEREWQAARAALTHPVPTHEDGSGKRQDTGAKLAKAVFGIDLVPAPHTSGEVTEDDVAARMWKAEAEDCGAPASVAENRTRAAFDDQASDLKDRWRKFARAAIAALRGDAS